MRNGIHFLISAILWGVFFYHWHIVSRQGINAGTALAIKVLSTLIVVGLTLTILWVAHNLRLARINQRRGHLPAVPESLTKDKLGRSLQAPELRKLKEAPVVEIRLAESRKTYSLPGAKT